MYTKVFTVLCISFGPNPVFSMVKDFETNTRHFTSYEKEIKALQMCRVEARSSWLNIFAQHCSRRDTNKNLGRDQVDLLRNDDITDRAR